MKNYKVIFVQLLLIIVYVFPFDANAQQNGDYRTKKSGDWKKKQTWQEYKNGSWENAQNAPGNEPDASVTIRSGHTVEFDKNKIRIKNLEVEANGKLYRNHSSSENDLEIHGNIVCNGTIGNGSSADALVLCVNGESTTISGTGDCRFYRISKTSNAWASAQLIIDTKVELTIPSGVSVINTKNNTNLEIVVNPGASLTSHATIDLRNGNPDKTCSIYLKSDETGYGSLITPDIGDSDATNTTVERYLSQNKWHYITSPVEDPQAQVFYDIYLMQFSEPEGTWSYITDPAQVLDQEMEGFSAWTSSNLLGNTTLQFQGTLNTGPKNINLTFTQNASHDSKGFNFVGNPYSSAVDWDYTGPNGWSKNNVDNAIYQWNGDMGVYGSYVNGLSVNQATNIIPAHQGFYVHCNQPTGSLGVATGAQLHDHKPFFKSGKEMNVLRFKSSGNGLTDETVIRFDQAASAEFDQELDALKIMGAEEAPQVYSISGEEIFSINSMPWANVVNLGFICAEPGVYSLSWEGIENFEDLPIVYLEDLMTGDIVDMSQSNNYSFSHHGNEPAHRFNICFEQISDVNNRIKPSSINVYSFGQEVFVKSQHTNEKRIELYDLTGRLLVSHKTPETDYSFKPDRRGAFIVRVITEKEITSKKVYLR